MGTTPRFRIHLPGPTLGNGQSLVLRSFYCLFLAGLSRPGAGIFNWNESLHVTVVFRQMSCSERDERKGNDAIISLEGILYQAINNPKYFRLRL